MDKKKRKPGPTAQRAAMEDAVTLREQGRGEIPEQDADDL